MNFLVLFLLFAIILSSVFVILSSNPMNSLCFLILSFVLSAIGLALINQEFFSMMYIIIYVGAIAVLFTFVVMMLNFKTEPFLNYQSFPTALIIAAIFIPSMASQFSNSYFPFLPDSYHISYTSFIQEVTAKHVLEALGCFIYTQGIPHLFLASFILLVAMIGCILLTLKKSQTGSHQISSLDQFNRDATQTIIKYRES